MNCYDLASNVAFETVVAPAAQSGTVNSAEVDKQGFNSLTFAFLQNSDDLGVGTIKLQHSDTSGSGYVDAGSDDVIGTQEQAFVAGANSKIGYVGSKRYVRAVVVLSVGGDACVTCVKGSPDIAPVA